MSTSTSTLNPRLKNQATALTNDIRELAELGYRGNEWNEAVGLLIFRALARIERSAGQPMDPPDEREHMILDDITPPDAD